MAIIGKIRSYSGLLIIIIGIALAAFVLGDLLKSSPRRSKEFGEVNDEKITYLEFDAKVEEQVEVRKQQSGGENLSAEEMFQIRQMVWNQTVRDIITGEEYDKIGLAVSGDELFDLVQGKNPHQYIIQNFTDPKTGQFNPASVINFLKSLDQQELAVQKQWASLESYIKADRVQTKYNNLISKAYYVPTPFAKLDYERRNTIAKFRIIGVRYNTIPDSSVTVSEEDLEKYYDEHAYEYEQEESRDIEYVAFDVRPSEEDILKIQNDVDEIYKEFFNIEGEDVEGFVNAKSDERYDSTFYKKDELPVEMDSAMFSSKIGTIIGPYVESNVYNIARLVDVQMRPDSMRASHILVSFKGAYMADKITRTKEEAEKVADSLLAIVRTQPFRFAEIASSLNDDNTAKEKGGDLDWFADGTMVYAFNQACLTANVGGMKIAETPFGYHVILVTGKTPVEKKVRVARIYRNLEPSSETYQEIYNQASEFVLAAKDAEAFEKTIVDRGLNKRIAENIRQMDNRISGIENPREIIRWMYNENTEKSSISSVFDTESKYIIALLKETREKGIPTFEQIRTTIEPLALREKKAEIISEKIKASLTKTQDINQLAAENNCKVDTFDFISFTSYSIPGYGPEPKVIGKTFTMKEGAVSEAIKGSSAIFVVKIDGFTQPQQTEDYSTNRMQLMNTFQSRVLNETYNSLEKNATIIDNRIWFY